MEGGLAMGVGYALSEEIKYDSKGKQLNDGFHKYMLPTAMDIPEMKAIIVEAEDPTGPFGAKGVGETGLVATALPLPMHNTRPLEIRAFKIP